MNIKKDNEIAFLKETVRVECEERMGLVASVAKLQKDQPDPHQRLHLVSQNTDPLSRALSNAVGNGPEVKESLNSKDAEFLRLFKNASVKNAKRLAKQSRSSLGNY